MRRSVLVVEDNPSDEKLTLRALNKAARDLDIEIARDGEEALALLAALVAADRPPALVLLDLKLPKVDGLEVVRRARADERTRTIPIVMLTSSHQDEDIVASYAHGANAYVRKPLDFAEFVATARAMLEFWLGLNELPAGGSPR